MNRLKSKIEGQSLFEIVVAIGVAALIIGSTTTAIVVSLQSDRNNAATQKAYALAEELLNNVSSYAEGNWGELYRNTGATNFYLEFTATSATSTQLGIATGTDTVSFTFTATSTEENVTYTTWFNIADVERNSSQAIGSGVSDPSTREITAHVSWDTADDTREIELVQILSNIRSLTVTSDDWSGSSGSAVPVTIFDEDYYQKTDKITANATSILVTP